eukprot:TRINITY_DN4923_c0_g1_i6.p1 TRINITY_DN4923_c0_g1~~TRINITY_DN4923_c0_g1_i6.p1  ORF type:complete len:574 (+),score=137.63 TRINITY_DN4923_c0_g1_i6:15-1736(+)
MMREAVVSTQSTGWYIFRRSMSFFVGPVDVILSQKSFTLEALLDEDDIVVETKKARMDLLGFLTRKDILAQLISYLVNEPPRGADEKVRMRYPAVTAELLSCEDEIIEKALLEHPDFGNFFEFFKPQKVNLLLSNVVLKVLMTLLDTQGSLLISRLYSNPETLNLFFNHLECSSVVDFIVKLISTTTPEGIPQNWLANGGFVELLYNQLSRSNAKLHTDVCNALHEILSSLSWDHPLMRKFSDSESCKLLMKHTLEEGNVTGFNTGMRVAHQLLRSIHNYMKEPDEDEDEEGDVEPKIPKPEANAPFAELPFIVQELTYHFEKFQEILFKPSPLVIHAQNNKTFEAFGYHRLCILENIDAMVEPGFTTIARKVIDSKILDICWNFVFKFEVNTFCHRNVDKITEKVLELVGGETQINLLKRLDLVGKLINGERLNSEEMAKGAPRSPCLPYLHQTGRMLQLMGEINDRVLSFIQSCPGWTEYSQMLDEEKKRNDELAAARNIGGDDEANIFKPGQHYGDLDVESEAYLEGRDGDADDLALPDDVDMDSSNDFDDYDIDQAEILLTKQEVEAFA